MNLGYLNAQPVKTAVLVKMLVTTTRPTNADGQQPASAVCISVRTIANPQRFVPTLKLNPQPACLPSTKVKSWDKLGKQQRPLHLNLQQRLLRLHPLLHQVQPPLLRRQMQRPLQDQAYVVSI